MAVKSVFVLTMCALGIQAAFGDTREEQDARPAIVPRPVEMAVNPGEFTPTLHKTQLVAGGSLEISRRIAVVCGPATGVGKPHVA